MRKAWNVFGREGGWVRALPFVLLFCYCLAVYQFVPEMFDDFYLGSLSAWGVTEPNVIGTNFNLSQLLHFALEQYQTRLTRVVSLVLMHAPLLRVQWLYRIIDSLGITAVFYCIYHFSGVKKTTFNAFASVFLFGLLSQRMYTEGAFWFGTGLISFVANALLFSSLFLFRRIGRGKANVMLTIFCCVLSALTCLMQEITAFTLCCTYFCVIVYKTVKRKKLPVSQCIVLLFAALGAAVVCFGPGNMNRFEVEAEEIYSLSERVARNLDGFVTTVFHKSNMPFLVVFLLFVCCLNVRCRTKSRRVMPSLPICLWSASFIPLSLYYSPTSLLNLLNYNYSFNSVFMVVNCFLYLCYAGYLIVLEVQEYGGVYLNAFGFAGLMSVVTALFYSSYIAHRMEILLYISLFCIMLRVFAMEPDGIWKWAAFGGTACISCVWLAVFLLGYWKNAPILMENREILMEAGEKAAAGEDSGPIAINTDYNRYFTPEFVYPGEPGYPNLPLDVKSFREYYNVPDTVEIIYGIGGRNYIPGTGSMKRWAKRGPINIITDTDGAAVLDWQANPVLEWNAVDTTAIKYSELRGKVVTVSLDVRSDDADLIDNMLYENGGGFLMDICIGSVPGSRQRWIFLDQIAYPKLSTQWQHLSTTLTLTDDAFTLVDDPTFVIDDDSCVYISITNRSTYRMQIKHLKLELGSEATAWAPALEDAEDVT